MASTDVAELRTMPDEQLHSELDDSQRALFNLRFQAATRQLADVSQVRAARRRVARIKTLLRERELIAAYGELVETSALEPATSEPQAGAEVEEPEEIEGPADGDGADAAEDGAEDAADEASAEEPSDEDEDAGADDEDRE